MEAIEAAAARRQLGTIIDRARLQDTPTLITRYGAPAAVVVPVDWYESHRSAEDTQVQSSASLPGNSGTE